MFTAALAAFFVVGCGGGGNTGSSGQTVPIPAQTKTALAKTAQGALMFGQTRTTGGFGQKQQVAALYTALGRLAIDSFGNPGRATAGWTYDPVSGFYYQFTNQTQTSVRVLLSTGGTTNNAGYIDVTRLSGGNGVFPASARLDLHMILLGSNITGPFTVTFFDNTFQNWREQMSISSSSPAVNITCDLTGSPTAITGTLGFSGGGVTVNFTNIVATSTRVTANFTGTGGLHGDVVLNADNSGRVTVVDSLGTWILSWDTSYLGTLTSPSGKAINIGSLLSY